MKHRSNRRGWFVAAAVGLVAAGVVCSCSRTREPDEMALARVGKSEITVGEFVSAMERRSGSMPQVFEDPANRKALLDEMVRLEVLAERARREGYADDPEIASAITRMLAGRLDRDALERGAAELAVTDEEVRAAYEAGGGAFRVSARVHVAVIHIQRPAAVSLEKDAELLAKAEQVREEAVGLPADTRHFGYLAAKYSDDQATRYRGGDLGWISAGAKELRWPAGVVEAAFAISSPGGLSPVVTADNGYYLVKLVGKEEESLLPFEQVAPNIRNRLEKEKRATLLDRLYRESLATVPVTVDEKLLSEVAPKASAAPGTMHPPAIPMK